jgi:hypothetical protein
MLLLRRGEANPDARGDRPGGYDGAVESTYPDSACSEAPMAVCSGYLTCIAQTLLAEVHILFLTLCGPLSS